MERIFEVLQKSIDTAKKNNISTIVVASTTGATAKKLLDISDRGSFRIIIVTHDEGKSPAKRRFDEDIRRELESNGFIVYTHNFRFILFRKIIDRLFGKFGFPRWYKYIREIKTKYGTGIKVCYIITKMLAEGGILKEDMVIAVAGTTRGVDSAGIFSVNSRAKWPILEKVIE